MSEVDGIDACEERATKAVEHAHHCATVGANGKALEVLAAVGEAVVYELRALRLTLARFEDEQ